MKKIFIFTILINTIPTFSFSNNLDIKKSYSNIIVDCDALAYDVFHIWYDNGFSQEYSTKKANEAKTQCKNELKKAE